MAQKAKDRALWVAVLICGFVLIGLFLTPRAPVHAQSQSGSFSLSFSFPYHTVSQKAYFSIPNRGQVSDSVSYVFTAGISGACTFELDGSNDGKTWFVLANGTNTSLSLAASGTIYSNGYYPFKRIATAGCASGGAGTISGVYTGYPSTIPVSETSSLTVTTSAQNAGVYEPSANFLLQGFQCFNPNTSVTYLQLQTAFSSGTILLQIGIVAGATYNYQGPAIIWSPNLIAYSSSTFNTQTPATDALICTFEINPSGPFYPANPLSAL